MSDELEFAETEERAPRPGFLTVLCILSYIWIGISLLANIVNLARGPFSAEEMKDLRVDSVAEISKLKNAGMDSLADLMEKIQFMAEDSNNNFYLAAGLNIFIVLLGLYGVIRMYKGAKLGFHLYIVYCLMSIGAVYAYVSPAHIPNMVIIFNLVLSALFVFMYSRNLKWLK